MEATIQTPPLFSLFVMSRNKLSVAVVGAGISGIASARLLADLGHHVTLYEKNICPGGLIRCTSHKGALFHRVGGHVFNSKDNRVSNWFRNKFDIANEFTMANRNAVIYLDGGFVPYPIELNLRSLPDSISKLVINDLVACTVSSNVSSVSPDTSLRDFLLENFGKTLCDLYFFGYNQKIWKSSLSNISISWLEGKLPMSTPLEIIYANVLGLSDQMVHSKFYYPLAGGSQFIVDRLSKGLNMITEEVSWLSKLHGKYIVNRNPDFVYDQVIYTGDLRQLYSILDNCILGLSPSCFALLNAASGLQSQGTTTMLCECDSNPYSWVYLPSERILPHRIIVTGNFSPSNNPLTIQQGRTTCTVECSGFVTESELNSQLKLLPFSMTPISYNYCETTYVMHDDKSLKLATSSVAELREFGIHCVGRFAEWQYYNMDAAISSAMRTVDYIQLAT